MKSTLTLIVSLLALTLSLSSYANKRDSILLQGKVFNNDERVHDVVINIYAENDLIKSVKVKSSNFFKTYLPKDHFLTIEITAPDFHTKRFFFDSHVPSDLKRLPGYKFDMDIFSEKELANVNPSILDFPAGLVKYHTKKKVFLRDKAYTKKIKKKYFQLLEEAKMSERGALEDSE